MGVFPAFSASPFANVVAVTGLRCGEGAEAPSIPLGLLMKITDFDPD
jgi:hypothetical protein